MPHHMYALKDKRIDIEADHYFSFEDVKYCLYCGNRTQLEAFPDRPAPEPYKPDLSLKPKTERSKNSKSR